VNRVVWACVLAVVAAGCGSGTKAATVSAQGLPIDHPGLERENARDPRRLSHLQLTRSVAALMGTTWIEDGFNVLGVLSSTLGDPDYQEITTENLDPSPLYVKFMEDMANNVCANAPAAILEPKPTHAENVSALKLKLHGEYLPPGDPSLKPLLDLYDKAGVRAVCVALLAAPEFFLY
jgi:hypothetical protein